MRPMLAVVLESRAKSHEYLDLFCIVHLSVTQTSLPVVKEYPWQGHLLQNVSKPHFVWALIARRNNDHNFPDCQWLIMPPDANWEAILCWAGYRLSDVRNMANNQEFTEWAVPAKRYSATCITFERYTAKMCGSFGYFIVHSVMPIVVVHSTRLLETADYWTNETKDSLVWLHRPHYSSRLSSVITWMFSVLSVACAIKNEFSCTCRRLFEVELC